MNVAQLIHRSYDVRMTKMRRFHPCYILSAFYAFLFFCVRTAEAKQLIDAIPADQPPLARSFPPSPAEQIPIGTGKIVIFTRENLNKTGQWDFIAGAWECIPSRTNFPITKRVEFCHSSWEAWPLLNRLAGDEHRGLYPRFVRLQVDARNSYSVNLYDINYRTWDVHCIWQGKRLNAFGIVKNSIICRSAEKWFSLDSLTGIIQQEVPCIPIETDGSYWIVRKNGESAGNWSYDPIKQKFLGHFRDIDRPLGYAKSLITQDGRTRAWVLATMPNGWLGGSLKGTFVVQRDGQDDDIQIPVTFLARLGRGIPVIPIGINLKSNVDGKIEFAAQLEKPGTTERVWMLDIVSGNVSESVRPHQTQLESDFAIFDGVRTPEYLRPYLKDVQHFGRSGLAPAFLMYLGLLKTPPEYPDCEAGVSDDGRHIFYKAKKGSLSNVFIYGDTQTKEIRRWQIPDALRSADSMEFVWVETP